jgi:hypothetical protein
LVNLIAYKYREGTVQSTPQGERKGRQIACGEVGLRRWRGDRVAPELFWARGWMGGAQAPPAWSCRLARTERVVT